MQNEIEAQHVKRIRMSPMAGICINPILLAMMDMKMIYNIYTGCHRQLSLGPPN
jgi:hypothetical protein